MSIATDSCPTNLDDSFDSTTLTMSAVVADGDINITDDDNIIKYSILNCVEEYSMADPEILLLRHRFLYDTDFTALGSGSTSHCLLWLADMEAAVATSRLVLSGTLTSEPMSYFSSDNPMCLSGLTRQVF
jgi:hypothetical protein